jgi:hypothetical protein
VPETLIAPFLGDWTLCLFDVAELSRCSADGCREVVGTILMFTWGT